MGAVAHHAVAHAAPVVSHAVHHAAPVVHAAPLAHHAVHAAPVVAHHAVAHAAPVVAHAVHHAAPVVHAAPAYHAPAPVVKVAAPAYHAPVAVVHAKETPEPYTYTYGVANAAETSDANGVVSGSYSVSLPDGRIQHVKYTADHVNGYVAEVTYEGTPVYPEAKPYVAPKP